LAETGLTDRQLLPEEFHRLPDYGIGLTDLAKFKSGADNKLASDDFDIEGFKARIGRAPPHALAFNGIAAGRVFLGRLPRERLAPGRQPDTFARAAVFVLPSTSGSARGFWSIEPWRELAEYVRSAP